MASSTKIEEEYSVISVDGCSTR